MILTQLLKTILENSKKIKEEFGGEFLCASHVAVAVADFCKTRYMGITDFELGNPRFEEERLRYIFSKEIKLSSYFRLRLAHNVKDKVKEEKFDISLCEQILALRKTEILSADILFLCALQHLHKSYLPTLKSISTDDSVLSLLADTDKNICDYVVCNIEKICNQLKEKSSEACAIRDWKPAKKFAEPENVLECFFSMAEKTFSANVLSIRFPKFFGTADLKISIHNVDGIYFVHDNGCAIRHLSRRISDKQRFERALKRVCHPCWIHKGKITGKFAGSFAFFEYLKMLVFVAHADLYYTKASCRLCYKEKGYSFVGADKAEPLDKDVLIDLLKQGIGFSYDENQGLYCRVDAKCSLSSARMFFLIETLENGRIRLSDRKKGAIEGEIFEEFYWSNDDITPYSKFISKIASRFNAEFDGRDVYLTDKTDNFGKALFKFFNLAVLCSEIGHNIE